MNRRRLEHAASILRDLGLAAVIGGAGDVALNPDAARGSLDFWGVACGAALLAWSIYVIGIDERRRRG